MFFFLAGLILGFAAGFFLAPALGKARNRPAKAGKAVIVEPEKEKVTVSQPDDR